MQLTPADIQNMAFKRPSMGKRGYDEEDVDAFLDEVEEEMTRLLEENAALRDRIQHGAPDRLAASSSSSSATMLTAEVSDVAAQLEHVQAARDRAEEHARDLQTHLEQARAATAPPAGGNDRVAPVLIMAQHTADEHLREAKQTAEAMLTESRDKAAKLTSEAQLKAGAMESDARRNHTDSINRIAAERTALLDEINRLECLAESYRSALRRYIVEQVHDLDGGARQA
jgi:DivIVA domain-containing protein